MTDLTRATIDLVCKDHEVPLEAKYQITVLRPADPSDFSQGWTFELEELACPSDEDGECCDSWEVRAP